MTLIEHIQIRLASIGVDCSVIDSEIIVNRDEAKKPLKIRSELEWEKSFQKYHSARSISFDVDQRLLLHNTSLEIQVTRLAPQLTFNSDQYALSDSKGNAIAVGTCSHFFAFAFLDSAEYPKFFEARIKKRLADSIMSRKVSQLL